MKFDEVAVWVQVHDIPIRFMSQGVAEELCEVIGVVNKDTEDSETDKGSFFTCESYSRCYYPPMPWSNFFSRTWGERMGVLQV